MLFFQVFSPLLLATGCLALVAPSARNKARVVTTPGCGKELPAGQLPAGGDSHHVELTQTDGTPRSYLIHIPSNYSKDIPVPLIFSFHGHGRNASFQEALSQFSNEDWNPLAIAVYPQGVESQWQNEPTSTDTDDFGFVQNLIDHLSSRYCLDSTRIYASGMSTGGGITGQLACHPAISKQIAAFAPVCGAFYEPEPAATCSPETVAIQCNPGRSPLPILEFHGTTDRTIRYDGGARKGQCLPFIPHWVNEWSKRNGLGTTNTTTHLYDDRLHKYEYGDSASLGMVTHYLADGLGHHWPSIEETTENPKVAFYDATPIILDFFKRWTL